MPTAKVSARTGRLCAVALGLAGLGATAGPAPAQGLRHVDVLLVLAADVSRSIDGPKFELQRKGYAAALSDPRVLQAIASNPERSIAVAFVEWAGASSQAVVVDWTPIATAEDAAGFAAKVAAAPRSFSDRTAIGAAIDFSAAQVARAPFAADRRIIDISGDGASNSGPDAMASRDAALRGGITAINGLVILSSDDGPAYLVAHTHPPGGLAGYYRQTVIGGVASFVATADGFESFDRALIAKIVEELS